MHSKLRLPKPKSLQAIPDKAWDNLVEKVCKSTQGKLRDFLPAILEKIEACFNDIMSEGKRRLAEDRSLDTAYINSVARHHAIELAQFYNSPLPHLVLSIMSYFYSPAPNEDHAHFFTELLLKSLLTLMEAACALKPSPHFEPSAIVAKSHSEQNGNRTKSVLSSEKPVGRHRTLLFAQPTTTPPQNGAQQSTARYLRRQSSSM